MIMGIIRPIIGIPTFIWETVQKDFFTIEYEGVIIIRPLLQTPLGVPEPQVRWTS